MIQRYVLANLTGANVLPVRVDARGYQLWIEQCPDEGQAYANRNAITFGEDGGFGLPLIERSMYRRSEPWTHFYLRRQGTTPTAGSVVLLVSDDICEDIIMSPGIQII